MLMQRSADFNAVSARLAVLALCLFSLTITAGAAVRTEFPEQDPGLPFYARIQAIPQLFVIQDGAWAAIVFYRLPQCVPADFNLLNFFDAPRAFSCPLTVRGFQIWKNGPPPIDSEPIQVHTRGLGAVPVWFVRWSELQPAVSDGSLTVPELWGLSSLRIGSASFYQEGLRPFGGAQRGSLQIAAHGLLADGTSFQLEFTGVEAQADLTAAVRISFK